MSLSDNRRRVWIRTNYEFFLDFARVALSDAAYRLHHEVMTHSAVNGHDGVIRKRGLRTTTCVDDYDAAALELVKVGFWRDDGDEYVIIKHIDDQPNTESLARKRANQNRRAAASRHPDYLRLRQEIAAGKHVCARCDSTDRLAVDHIDPLSNDGRWDRPNLQVLCQRCNSLKGAKIEPALAKMCRSCGKVSGFLDGGYCRAAPCRAAARKLAVA